MLEITPEQMRAAIVSLIDIRRTSTGACEAQLPLFYPNGDSVTVTVHADKGEYVIHDSGNGVMVLNAHGVELSKKLSKRLTELALAYGCEFSGDRIAKRCSFEDVGVCAAIVANASRSVGDQLLSQPRAPMIDFREEVISRIRGVVGAKRIRENEEMYGESGYSYKVSAVILDDVAARPIAIVEPIKDHEAATKKFREFWDLSRSSQYLSTARLSLYDGTKSWNQADLILLQEVSNVVRLEDAERRVRALAEAA